MNGPQRLSPRGFDPGELGAADAADVAEALDGARRLQTSIEEVPIVPSAGFSDRVMSALVDEPSPAPAGFLIPLRRRGFLGGFAASVRQAWASAGGAGRPAFARAAALAYVLAVAVAGTSLAGVATIGAAGALGLLGPIPTESSAPVSPDPSSPTPSPSVAPEPTIAPSLEPSAEPSAGPSLPAGPTPSPSESPESSDDHGGGGAEPSDDHGGSGSGGDDDATPEPTDTPRPTGTPKPTQTPH